MLREFYGEAIALRQALPALTHRSKEDLALCCLDDPPALVMRRWRGSERALAAFAFGENEAAVTSLAAPGLWRRELDSAEARWRGAGSPAPESLVSNGRVDFRMAPKSVCVFSYIGEE